MTDPFTTGRFRWERREWMTSPPVLAGIIVNILLLALALALSIGSTDPMRLDRYLSEDGFVEWLQFLAFSMLAMLLMLAAADRWVRRPALKLDAFVLAGLGIVVALAALEEISWFQRVLHVESPDFFRQHNRQGETNLHNLALGDSSLNKRVLIKTMILVGLAHNLVLPLLARRFSRVRDLVEGMGLYLPPLSAAVAYVALVLLSQVALDHPRRGELGEAFGAVHYLCTAFSAYALGTGYGRPTVFTLPEDRARVSVLFVALVVLLVFIAWLLAVGYSARVGA